MLLARPSGSFRAEAYLPVRCLPACIRHAAEPAAADTTHACWLLGLAGRAQADVAMSCQRRQRAGLLLLLLSSEVAAAAGGAPCSSTLEAGCDPVLPVD